MQIHTWDDVPVSATNRFPVSLGDEATALRESSEKRLESLAASVEALAEQMLAQQDRLATQALRAGENMIGMTGFPVLTPLMWFTRPADTTAYASGDLVANSTTAAAVMPLSCDCARVPGGGGVIAGVHLRKSAASVTTASFRVHAFTGAPTFVTGGDNSALSTVLATGSQRHIAQFDVTFGSAGADGAFGLALAALALPFRCEPGSRSLWWVVEAQSAYTPASGEVFELEPLILPG